MAVSLSKFRAYNDTRYYTSRFRDLKGSTASNFHNYTCSFVVIDKYAFRHQVSKYRYQEITSTFHSDESFAKSQWCFPVVVAS